MKTRNLSFDLISDLHVSPRDEFSWAGQATSLNAVVVGDISKDRETMLAVMREISSRYHQVYFIDGNAEHRFGLEDLDASKAELVQELKSIKNLIHLQNRVVLHDELAIVGSNGWWTYDLDPNIDEDQVFRWCRDHYHITDNALMQIYHEAMQDYIYMCHAVQELQSRDEITKIMLVTHTVPLTELVEHDIGLSGTYGYNIMGNSKMRDVLDHDINNKVCLWVFGHYHSKIDLAFNEIRFCNNPRGRISDNLYDPYYPLRLDIEV